MGLHISVGMLENMAGNPHEGEAVERWQEEFDLLSAALADEGITWREPALDAPARPDEVLIFASFPSRSLIDLRRAYVLVLWGERFSPAHATCSRQYDLDCEKIDDEASMLSSHLLCHSDYAGYYIPVDFDDPLFLPSDSEVWGGGIVGSSQRLLAELRTFAGAIGVRLDQDGALSGEESARLDDAFTSEEFAWHQLYKACRTSIATGRALVFH